MTLQIGSRLGHYRILSLLGRGGMADVYRAEDERLGRVVALKALPPEFARDPELVERFRREVRAAARLNHPNIVTVFEFGQGEGQHFYTMEMLTGGDLKGRIRAHPGGMPPTEAGEVAVAIARALDYAHRRGFVHRDVKPENILFGEDGTPQLTDFGIARAMSERTRMTKTGMSIGSPHYMSPEQARGELVDGRSDVYSLGVVLYEMLSGRLPFDSADTFEVGLSHLKDPVPQLPGELAAWQPVVERLMAKAPEDRYGSAAEVAELLSSEEARTLAPPSIVAPVQPDLPARTRLEEAAAPVEEPEEGRGSPVPPPVESVVPPREAPSVPLEKEEEPPVESEVPAGSLEEPEIRPESPVDSAEYPPGSVEARFGSVEAPATPVEPDWRDMVPTPPIEEEEEEEQDSQPEDWLTHLQAWATGQEEAAGLPRGMLAAVAGGLLALIVVGMIFLALPDKKPPEQVRRNGGGEEPRSVLGGDARLFVETTPPGAEVLVDGRRVGRTPLQRYDISAGLREITLRHPDYETVRIGGRRFRDGRVVRIRQVLEAATGELMVTTTPPGAWVEVNGERVEERTPVTLGGLPTGWLEVKLGAREHRSSVVEVEIPKNGVARLEQALVRIPYGTLTLHLEPRDARVTLPDVAPRYRPGIRLPDGPHRVIVRRNGYRRATRTITVLGDTRVRIALERKRLQAGATRVFDGIEFVWIPPGEFRMGSTGRFAESDERPVRRVRVTRGFWLGKYEVTQSQWLAVMGSYPSHFSNCGGNCPVEEVSWNDVQEFIRKLNVRSGGNRYGLPTEAEWEYGARAGTTTDTCAGDITRARGNDPVLNRIAWYRSNSGSQTHPVGRKAPNAWGLHDMLGNVYEWVGDWYGDYPGGTATDPVGLRSGSYRVFRGGSWFNNAEYCRSAYRGGISPGDRRGDLGFRLLRR